MTMKVPASFRWCFLFIILVVCWFPSSSIAYDTVFSDEFTFLDGNHWEVYPNLGGEVKIINNENISLSSVFGQHFPYVFLKNVQIPEDHYVIETKFRFSGSLSFGNGIIFTDNLLSNGTTDDLKPDDMIFAAWPLDSSTIDISTTLCLNDSINCTDGSFTHLAYVSSQDWITLKIAENGGNYRLFVGNNIFETRGRSRNISQIWMGNPQTVNQYALWSTIFVDYINISRTITNNKTPVIIVPGFGGSWDLGAVLSGMPGNNWRVPEQITVYDGLINSLKGKGYVGGTDLFLFPYDWRKPLDSLADDLNSFIVGNNLSGKKINLIGHSMGGLVARAYAQKYEIDNIDNIITAGSPHFGTVDSYGLWEGAVFWGNVWWEKALLALTSELNRLPGEKKIDTL